MRSGSQTYNYAFSKLEEAKALLAIYTQKLEEDKASEGLLAHYSRKLDRALQELRMPAY